MDATDSRMAQLPCNSHEADICSHNAKLENIGTSLARIEGSIELLMRLFPQTIPARRDSILSNDEPDLSQKSSPKCLNDNGARVFDTFQCADFLNQHGQWLVAEIEKFKPKTALDVENTSLAALRIASSDDRFNEIKNMIYHSPSIALTIGDGQEKKVDIALDDVLFVMSLPLRDMYLKKHPELLT